MKKFLTDNSAEMRMYRTIVQGLIGVVVSNIDVILGQFWINPALKPVIAAAVMAVLAPIMAELGKRT